jgi:hypothetical protein
VTVAAIADKEFDERAHSFDISTVKDGPAVAYSGYQPGAGKNTEVRRKRVLRAPNFLGDRASRESGGLALHQQPKNREPRRLPQGGQRRQGMRSRH